MRGLMLSILFSSLLLIVLVTLGLNFYTNSIRSTTTQANKSGGNLDETSNPTNLATDVKTQVDLKNIQTSLTVYFSEYGYYPFDPKELVSGGYLNEMDLTKFSYQRCDADTVVVKKGDAGFKLENERLVNELSC